MVTSKFVSTQFKFQTFKIFHTDLLYMALAF